MWKRYVPLIIVMIIVGVTMFLLYGLDSLRREKYETAIVVGDNTSWIYKKKRWIKVSSANAFEDLNWKNFEVYENNERVGSYNLWHDDKWYVFDDKRNAINIEGEMLAYRSNYDITMDEFSKEEITDNTYVNTVLTDHNLSNDNKFTTTYKTSVDIDHDGSLEEFYVISNVFPLNFQPEKIFSFVFMVKDETIYYLYEDVADYRVYAGCSPDIITFIDANADNNDELIVSCFQYSNLGRVDMLYNFNGENFNILISNQ